MARSHGKILVDIWIDPDFIRLGQMEQWCYFMLLSQPKLNLVGCIDYEPHRWATKAHGITEADVKEAVVGLECAGFVCVDLDTAELLIRTMTRHDGLRTNNPKLLKGLWGQWKGIASPMLRKVAVDNMPERLFETEDCPSSALQTRRSAPTDWAIEYTLDGQSDARSFRPPPSTTHRPTSAPDQSATRSDEQTNQAISDARAALAVVPSPGGKAQERGGGDSTAVVSSHRTNGAGA